MRYLLIACLSVLFSVNTFAEKVKRDFNVEDFSKISVASGFDLYISQGDKESVSIELNDDMEKYLIVEVENNTLKVRLKKKSFFKSFRRTGSMKATIVVRDINRISVSGGGDVQVSKLVVDKLSTSISGGGRLNLNVVTNKLKCATSGGGDIILSGKADELSVSMSGGGDLVNKLDFNNGKVSLSGGGSAKIYCENTESFKASLSGGGNISVNGELGDISLAIIGGGNAKLSGKANLLKASVSGGGRISAKEFVTENCKLSISGGGGASVNVIGELKISASGGGSIKCYGKPDNVVKSLSGGCRLRIIQ